MSAIEAEQLSGSWGNMRTQKGESLLLSFTSSSLHYLSARTLHQGLCYGVEVGFAAKQAVQEHQRSALSLPVEHVVGQVDWAGGG